jgi:molybdenum cofactor cytidylyltransferase
MSAHPITPSPDHPIMPPAAILLAAGQSRRMGRLKMLLPFGDRPMLARVIESFIASGTAEPIIVVTGHAAEEIRAAVGEYDGVRWVHNPDHIAGGMLSSVKAGVTALPAGCPAFFVALGDQPMVRPETLDTLAAAWRVSDAAIVAPAHEGRRGHPILIAARLAPEILALDAADTLRTVTTRFADQTVILDVNDPATIADVDTPEDYDSALVRWREMECEQNERRQ